MPTPTSRLLQLLSLLQSRRDWPGAVLAERLQTSARTVRRDVERLRELGYRIEATSGPDGGYRLDAGAELPPLLFDDDQVLALAVALQAATTLGAGIEEDALRALTTVRQVMPSRLRHRLEALAFTAVRARRAASERVSTESLLAISTAVRAREVLRFSYRHAAQDEDEPPRRHRVEPHHLVTADGRWYLVAWDLERDDWRIYRVDRLTPSIPTGPRFAPREVPGADAAEYVAARFKGSESENRWPCVGTVVLHRPAREVTPVVDDGVVTDRGAGTCTLEPGAWSWLALAASVARFDTEIDVIEPPELVDAFAELARRHAATAAAAGAGRRRRSGRRGPTDAVSPPR